MANTLTQFPAGQPRYRVNFDYLARQFVVLTLLNTADATLNKRLVAGNDYRFFSPTIIEVIAPQDGYDIMQIARETSSEPLVSFKDGSVLTASDLTVSELQAIHIAEEGRDQTVELAKTYADSALISRNEADEMLQQIKDVGAFGYTPVGSFELGANVELFSQSVKYGSGTPITFWRWDGALPKVVEPNSTPESSGGIGEGKWVDVTDSTLRGQLAGPDGYALIPSIQIQRWRDSGDIRGWGAKCDGVTDDTLAWKDVAQHADATGSAVVIPAGTTVITEKVVFNKPVTLIGAAPSPVTIGYENDGQGEPRGSIILSRVHGDYAIDVNPPENNQYKRGGHIANVHLLADRSDPLAVEGKGMRLCNLGWNGSFNNLCVEGFHGGGLQLSQVQDSLFNQLEIVDCGKDGGGAPALTIDRWTNLCTFVRCRLESCGRLLYIGDGAASLDFLCPHFELGDYATTGVFGEYDRPNSRPVIDMQNCNNIRFQGGMMIGATINSQVRKFGVTADTAAYYMYINSDATDVHFSDMWLGYGWGNGKFVQFTGSGSFVNCVFNYISSDVYSLDLRATSMVFSGNTVNYSHDTENPSGKLLGAAFANATIDKNRFVSWYPGTPVATTGAFLAGQGVPNNRLGINEFSVVGANDLLDGSFKFVDQHFCEEAGLPVGQLTLNLNKYDPAAVILLNESGSTVNIVGLAEGRRVRLFNVSAGVVTISNISPPLQIANGRMVELAYVKATGGLYVVG